MIQLWQFWQGAISDSGIDSIIKECETYPSEIANIGFDGSTDNDKDKFRSSEVRWIDRQRPNSKFISEMIWEYACEGNRNAFGFDISLIRDIQYTKYEAVSQGKYDWHIDTFWANPRMTDRKLSIVIQLTDPSEYEGGDFELDRQYPQPEGFRTKGSVFLFPSFLPHRVTPVTKGVRRSLVSWIEGPKFR